MSARLTAAVLLAGLSLTASAHAENDLLMSERFPVAQEAEPLAPVAAAFVRRESNLLSPEHFLDPQETETAAIIAVDLAMLQGPALSLSAVDQPMPGVVRPVSELVDLAPEFFLHSDADETLSWIAADLASAGDLATGSILSTTTAMAVPVEQPAVRSLTDDALAFEEYLLP